MVDMHCENAFGVPPRSQQLHEHDDDRDDECDVHEHHRAPHGRRILRGQGARRDEPAPWAMSGIGAANVLLADEATKAAGVRPREHRATLIHGSV